MKKKHLCYPSLFLFALTVMLFSCKKDKEEEVTPSPDPTPTQKMSSSYQYEFNNGQVVADAYYDGTHGDNLTATMTVEELNDAESRITVTLTNTVSGEMYMIHAHDAADASTTPNGTPYDETPNSSVFVKMVDGNGGSVSVSQTVNMSYSELTTSYDGFFVVHDPLQPISTIDISTYLIVGTFARNQSATGYGSAEFTYDFNIGQLSPSYTYVGTHATDLEATLHVQELASGESRVSVWLHNTLNNEMYMVHAHDMADASTTPNGTPYDETPNSDVCTLMINGNGSTAYSNQISSSSYSNITATYDGFFVVHDPLQAINTTDPTTYVVLGVFAR